MKKRKALSPMLRFEVFKRDKFACQYCGRKAPDVVLNADHIKPVVDGGTDDLMNLVTACADCNAGKSDRILSDDAAVTKSRAQAEDMQERAEQVKMMAEWQCDLSGKEQEIEAFNDALKVLANRVLTDPGRKTVRRLLREFGLAEVLEALHIANERYEPDQYLVRIGGICRNRKLEREDPLASDARKIITKCRYRLGDSNAQHLSKPALKLLLQGGKHSVDSIIAWATRCSSWREFNDGIAIAMDKANISDAEELI